MGKTLANDIWAWFLNILFIGLCAYYYYRYWTTTENKSFLGKIGMLFVAVFCGLIMTSLIGGILKSISWIIPILLLMAICAIFNIK